MKDATIFKDWSVSALTAGFLAVLVSYAGPMVLLFQAASAAQVTHDITVTWVWAVSIGAAVSGIALSWATKMPVITAWSAPGTALLITLFPGLSLSEMVGAYLTAAVLILLIGWSGCFDRLVNLIPRGIAAGMMAGILFRFGTQVFASIEYAPLLTWIMLAAFLLTRQWVPRYSIAIVFIIGLAVCVLGGWTDFSTVEFSLTQPIWTPPEWTWHSTLSLALPLVLVSLTGQYLPGMSLLHLSGYRLSAKPVIATTSLVSLLVAGFGGITIVPAAITAALCTGKDAHTDADKRYIAGISNGMFYLLGALFSGAIVKLFTVLPEAFVMITAGLALVGAVSANISAAVAEKNHREASVLTFLATASDMTLWGLGSAFWGVAVGMTSAWIIPKPAKPEI
ncbi:benzoate/H(+) symporter BenE family transporter [Neisseria leonii]|uniref:benzoate/H(+) symporter BenE family transporter n=1 Tax=Neisseria leonii TaxID=2995413 RepID=UPI00237C2D09|nr:benzoate/H(+) symporter BenE family transporter [Neisseria sp. 3986]MDD9325048.1 benzoate/H(+) symporter BenE family transporter [Neisseria sp. 3986]